MEQGRRVARVPFEKLIVDLDEALQAYEDIPDAVRRELAKIGLKPKTMPKMPEPELERSLSRMTNDELGDFQGQCAVWEAFLGEKFGDYKTIAVALKARNDRLLKKITEELREQAVPATRAKEQAKEDPRYCKALAEFTVPQRVAAELEERREGLKNQRKACSRYVEIRVKEIEAHTRTENVNNRRTRRSPTFKR